MRELTVKQDGNRIPEVEKLRVFLYTVDFSQLRVHKFYHLQTYNRQVIYIMHE